MSIKQNGQYQTSKGTVIDMNKLINKNELTPAVGNMKVNARGDKIGSGGQIIKPPSEIRKQPIDDTPVEQVVEAVDNKTKKQKPLDTEK